MAENPTRIEGGHYVAEVLQGDSTEPFWYYVLQRQDSTEILELVKFETVEAAIEGAKRALSRVNRAAAAQ